MDSPQLSNPPVSETPSRPALVVGGVGMLALAAFLLFCGMCSALFYVILPLTSPANSGTVDTNIALGALAGLGALLGGLFLWQSVVTLRQRDSIKAARVFPPVLVFIALFFVAVALGLAALALQSLARGASAATVVAFVFPPWHFLAASIPPIALLAYAAHRLGVASGVRALLVAFGWGALGATTAAIVAEVLLAIGFVVITAVALSLAPNSQQFIDQLKTQLELAQRTRDYSAIEQWMNDPPVLAGILVYAAVLVPFVEEALKALVVAFIDPRRTRLADALLWGIAAGAGFGFFENLFNSSATLTAWIVVAFLRVGATIMHVANGATMGRGWYAARVERRWSRLFIAYLVSVFFHAAWNAIALVLSSRAVFFISQPNAPLTTTLPAIMLALALLTGLVTLAALGLGWIVRSVRSAQTDLPSLERSE